jgi:hypothetical protein
MPPSGSAVEPSLKIQSTLAEPPRQDWFSQGCVPASAHTTLG